jgi:serine/threonine protein kinase
MYNLSAYGYDILSLLGKGGMSTVHLALNRKFNTKVAVKVLDARLAADENLRKRFISEGRNLFRLSHPNLARVTDLFEDDHIVFLVMEYIEGETLSDHIRNKGELTDAEIMELFIQMLDVLEYVHSNKLVHRDIKPSNFMIRKDGLLKLLDFGIAKNLDRHSAEYTMTDPNMKMGTVAYMSPEQVKNTSTVTHQTDIYSLGVVLWQMVESKPPYDLSTTSRFDIETRIVTEPLPKTKTHWDWIIEKSTFKNVASRYKSIMDIRSELIKVPIERNERRKTSTTKNVDVNERRSTAMASPKSKYQTADSDRSDSEPSLGNTGIDGIAVSERNRQPNVAKIKMEELSVKYADELFNAFPHFDKEDVKRQLMKGEFTLQSRSDLTGNKMGCMAYIFQLILSWILVSAVLLSIGSYGHLWSAFLSVIFWYYVIFQIYSLFAIRKTKIMEVNEIISRYKSVYNEHK